MGLHSCSSHSLLVKRYGSSVIWSCLHQGLVLKWPTPICQQTPPLLNLRISFFITLKPNGGAAKGDEGLLLCFYEMLSLWICSFLFPAHQSLTVNIYNLGSAAAQLVAVNFLRLFYDQKNRFHFDSSVANNGWKLNCDCDATQDYLYEIRSWCMTIAEEFIWAWETF